MAKKNIFKKTLAIALAAMLTFGAVPLAGLCGLELPSLSLFTASATEEEPVWTVATDDMLVIEGNTITGYTDKLSGNIEIPAKNSNGTAITTIASGAFENCLGLTAVKIPETIISIGWYAFKNTGLETVYFNATSCEAGSNMNEGYSTFTNNESLTKFVFGENVSKVPATVCASVKTLQEVEFKGTVTEIGDYAFYNCSSLAAIDLSDVKTIGEAAFKDCTTLKVTDKNTVTENDKGTIVFSNALLTIDSYAFENCTSIKEVTIPEKATYVGWQTFKNTGLETVYFNAVSCEMGSNANEGYSTFTNNSSLTKFVFGENVTKIPANACASVTNLQSVAFNGTVTEIGDYAFYNCPSLAAIDLSDVKTIGEAAFKGCTTLKVTDKNTATENDKGTIVFSDDLLTIDNYAFENCTSIKEVTIPEKATYVGWQTFKNTGLETVYFNATSCEMGSNANDGYSTFSTNANLAKFVFGENVTAIPVNACASATNLRTVEINSLVTTIGKNAFYNCTSLSNIHLAAYAKETFDFDSLTIGSGNDVVTEDIFTFGIENKTETNKEFDVTVSYISTAFDEEVKLSITETTGERENGSINISDKEISEQIGCFNIKMILADGSSTAAVQPDGKVTVKMAIPANYIGKTTFKIVHRLENGQRENFSTSPKSGEKKLSVSSDGKYWIFEVTSFSDFEFFAVEAAPSVSIKNNTGSKTISYGETLRLTANTSNMPADAKIFWYVDGEKAGEGTTFEVSPESGSVEVTVRVVDADGNDYAGADISDSQKVSVNSGFFQKLISFFKNLFGISRIVAQAFKAM